jgi:hypothetical protein
VQFAHLKPARIREIATAFPWAPADSLRHLVRVSPGPNAYRYGAQWFDGPQVASDTFGEPFGALFPDARLIARRYGNVIGSSGWATGTPQLHEWRGSQAQVAASYNDIAALTLSSVLQPGYDARPVLPMQLTIPGVALGPWHDAGSVCTSRGILLPDGEATLLDALRQAAPVGWELGLVHKDDDSWMSIRSAAGTLTTCRVRHGSIGTERVATNDEAHAEILAAAPFNDGAVPGYHFHLSVPRADKDTS